VENLSFQVGDSHSLDFEAGTYDLVYSHTAAHFFFDPVRALREQARVTKPGGWVIASGVRDQLITARYPECPNWQRVVEALGRCHLAHMKALRSAGDPVGDLARLIEENPTVFAYGDFGSGRKCPYWMTEAGLEVRQVEIKTERVQYAGAERMEPSEGDYVLVQEPETNMQKQLALWLDEAIDRGFLERETLERAKEEVQAWYQDPRAFNYWVLMFVAAKV
jgi:SAM-dependent methyltransferase